MQGCAALPRLFVQVPAGKDGRREREREEDREVSGQRAGVLRRGLGFVAGRASRPPERQPSWWQEVAWT